MPTYRVYYVSYQVDDPEELRVFRLPSGRDEMPEDYETDWEEDIDASNEQEALKRFFAGHLELSSDLGYLADDGATERVAALDSEEMDPNRTYIWAEGEKLMEFRSIAELRDLVSCPVCRGSGTVPPEVAARHRAAEGLG